MNRLISYFIHFSIWVLIPVGCTQKMDDKNREAAKQGIEGRKIQKISDADLIAKVYEQGDIIATAVMNGFSDSLEFENILYDLAALHQVEIKTVKIEEKNFSSIEQEILEAYRYNFTNDLGLLDNVQQLDDTKLLFTKPIVTGSDLTGMVSILFEKKEIIKKMD